jgi:hypothetical protein
MDIEEDIRILNEAIKKANTEDVDMNDCFETKELEAIEHILVEREVDKKKIAEIEGHQEKFYNGELYTAKQLKQIEKNHFLIFCFFFCFWYSLHCSHFLVSVLFIVRITCRNHAQNPQTSYPIHTLDFITCMAMFLEAIRSRIFLPPLIPTPKTGRELSCWK